jgi:hypothetical protein
MQERVDPHHETNGTQAPGRGIRHLTHALRVCDTVYGPDLVERTENRA